MLSTVMVALDGTIANVALPHIQSTMLASQEQAVWVLTSYFISSAIAMPLWGWLSNRIGRKPIIVASIAGFVLSSLACGLAGSLEQLVAFRIIQGICGASLVPLSQAVMLDIYPPEQHGRAMALYGMGSILGPILGPTLGGWLTETLNWRWIFLINVPFGALGFFLMSTFLDGRYTARQSKFDIMGFLLLSGFIATFQIMLDRGQQLDWFDSREILIEATLAGLLGFLTVVHMLTASDPFIKPRIFMNRNFLFGSVIILIHAMLVFTISALLAPMMQHLMGYSVLLSGMATAPRGVGTMVAMFTAGRLLSYIDPRVIMATGMGIAGMTLYTMAHFSLMMSSDQFIIVGLIQGFGGGLVFVPLTTIMTSTMDPQLRNEGSTLMSLIRSIAAAVGISSLQALTIRNAATVQTRLVEGVRPDNPILQWRNADADFDLTSWVAGTHLQIGREALMVAYLDAYYLLAVLMAISIPFCFLMKKPPKARAV